MERLIFTAFCVGAAGLIIGILIAWILNAFSGTTVVIPGTAGVLFASLAALVMCGLTARNAVSGEMPGWVSVLILTGLLSGAMIPIIIGNILRLNYKERLADSFGNHRWKWGRTAVGILLLVVALNPVSRPADVPPQSSQSERLAQMTGRILAWVTFAGGGLCLIRSGTRRRPHFSELRSAFYDPDSVKGE